MAKKSFKDQADSSMRIPTMQSNTSQKKEQIAPAEKRTRTSILVKPSLFRDFKLICLDERYVMADELEKMFERFKKEHGK